MCIRDRPTDVRVPWEPVWAAKVRVKSMTMAMLGMQMPEAPAAAEVPAAAPAQEEKKPGVKDLLKGIFGR